MAGQVIEVGEGVTRVRDRVPGNAADADKTHSPAPQASWSPST